MKADNFQSLNNNWEHYSHFDHDHDLYQDHEQHIVNNQYQYDEGSSNNSAGFTPGFDHTQYDNLNLHPQGSSPIGLTLRKSNSLLNLVEMTLSKEREQKKVESKPTVEKLKASNFHAVLLQIGSWKRISRNEGDLVVKLYYAKKKLVWEYLDGPLKNKIEIQWCEISAIRAFINEGEPGRLEIELNQPPQFGREINPQPRKHTQWKQTTDFTGGQASVCRRHSVIFPPGILDKQYEKLLQCDNRLFNLSQQPFPVNNYPYFYHDPTHCIDYSYSNVNYRPPTQFLGDPHSNSLTSVMSFEYLNEEATRHTNKNQERGCIQFEVNPANSIGIQDNFLPCYGQESWFPVQESQTKTLHEEIDSTGYENGIQELNSWVGVQDLYEFPWEQGMDDVRSLYMNQHYNTNWT